MYSPSKVYSILWKQDLFKTLLTLASPRIAEFSKSFNGKMNGFASKPLARKRDALFKSSKKTEQEKNESEIIDSLLMERVSRRMFP